LGKGQGMKQLSGLDASFLYLETPEMPMHVGALHVFELEKGFRGDFVRRMREHLRTRLPIAPALRRKLAWMPLNLANPAWIDDQPDLEAHVVRVKLKKGSGLAELEAKVGELHVQLLDRRRPLWRFFVFEGLAPGPNGERRYGMYSQLHHAAVDGQAAVALANAILDTGAEPRRIDADGAARTPKLKLGLAEMLSGTIGHQLQQYASMVRALPATLGTLSSAAKGAAQRSSARAADAAVGKLTLAPRTRLNVTLSATRSFAGVSLPLAEVKRLARAHGGTINDIVLALASGALRSYLQRHDALPRKSLVAAVPISLRSAGDTASNNQASMSLVSLGTQIADPAQRLAHVKAATAAMKATMGSVKSILPTDFPSLGVPWLMGSLAALYARAKVADRLPPLANVAISNVPGPAFPLYLAGAKMLTNYPTSIVVHGVALNITVQSYNESLDFGLIACGRAMPDIAAFADDLRQAFEQLRALPVAVATQVAPSAKRPARRRTAPDAPATAAPRPVKKAARRSRASAPAGRAAGR
jgi:WS/DGAT/MGAT family acyltransferase